MNEFTIKEAFFLTFITYVCCVLSCFSCVQLFVTPWTVPPPPQAPLSMEFSRQEHWSGLSFPPLEDLPDPGIERSSLTSTALAGMFFTISTTWEAWLVAKSIPKGRLSAKSQLYKNAISGSFFCDVVSVIDIIYIFIHIFYKFQNDIIITLPL